ncbi:MAG: hypothetical protein VB042_05380 [Victivallaceae bacterium]|nr:hypothetical protein [Victivallaceae bacterium]
MSRFIELEEVAAEIKSRLTRTGAFDAVEYAAADSFEQVAEKVKVMLAQKKAVILIGRMEYQKSCLVRKYTIGVVVSAPFRATIETKADAVWACAYAAARQFMPVFSKTAAPVMPEWRTIGFELQNWAPINLDAKNSSIILEIEAVEKAAYDKE